jgi:hypothetical protein
MKKLEGEFVVLVIGMRINEALKVHKQRAAARRNVVESEEDAEVTDWSRWRRQGSFPL